MVDYPQERAAPETKGEGDEATVANSFRNRRKARKKFRLARNRNKAETKQAATSSSALTGGSHGGPTQETMARLTPDPLVIFKKKNILNDQQIWAFQRIRRAVQVITDGTQMRVSRFSGVAVQNSRFAPTAESEHDIRITEEYTRWIDRMTHSRHPAGPVLDVIIDELSLRAVDRKRGKRKGWAKDHLRASLNLYGPLFSPNNRDI